MADKWRTIHILFFIGKIIEKGVFGPTEQLFEHKQISLKL